MTPEILHNVPAFFSPKRTHSGNEADDGRGQRRKPNVVASHDQHGINPRLQLRHLHHAQSAQIRSCIYQVSKWTNRLKMMHVTIVNVAGFKVKVFFFSIFESLVWVEKYTWANVARLWIGWGLCVWNRTHVFCRAYWVWIAYLSC